jgi:hypothetical protein
MIRAVRFKTGPKKSPSVSSTSPAWIPILTRKGSAKSVSSELSDRCARNAADRAAAGLVKTATSPSPVVFSTVPEAEETASPSIE